MSELNAVGLDAEDLYTIETIARNEQSGRITRYEVNELARVYRAYLASLGGVLNECKECAGTGFQDKGGARLTLARSTCGVCGGTGYLAALDTQPVPVAVKGLEWRNGYRDETVTIFQASFGGLYQVRVLEDGVWLDWPDRPASQFPTIEAAKASAQADYEARIRSALAPAQAVPGDMVELIRERDQALDLAQWSAVENNTIVNEVWELLGGPDATREGGQSLVLRVKEALAGQVSPASGERRKP